MQRDSCCSCDEAVPVAIEHFCHTFHHRRVDRISLRAAANAVKELILLVGKPSFYMDNMSRCKSWVLYVCSFLYSPDRPICGSYLFASSSSSSSTLLSFITCSRQTWSVTLSHFFDITKMPSRTGTSRSLRACRFPFWWTWTQSFHSVVAGSSVCRL